MLGLANISKHSLRSQKRCWQKQIANRQTRTLLTFLYIQHLAGYLLYLIVKCFTSNFKLYRDPIPEHLVDLAEYRSDP